MRKVKKNNNNIDLNGTILTIVVFSPCSLYQDATITECSLAFTKPFPMIVTPAHVCQRDRSPVLTGLVGKLESLF